MKNTRNLILTALMIAIGLILPPVVRLIPNGGVLFSPMHIPALLAGLCIGPVAGIITGIVCPLLNNALFGMPMGSTLIGMCVELPVYGFVSGILMRTLRNYVKNDTARVYIALIVAMLSGRIAGGLMQGLVLGAKNYSIAIWASSYLIGTAPAIVIHLILLPAVYFALHKAKLVA